VSHAIVPANDTTRSLPAFLGDVAQQPQLVAASVGTIAAGLVTRRPDLIRGGARMLAVHVVASAVRTAMRQRTHHVKGAADTAETPSPLSEAIVAGVVGWVAEAAIVTALKHLVPDRETAPK
jgi:hypothetical protein